jgi:O-antigen/teichoic acid export membrane protein
MSAAHSGAALRPSGMVADGLSLSASAGITAAAGMAGWVLAARLLPPAEIGHTSAFVSGFLLVAPC